MSFPSAQWCNICWMSFDLRIKRDWTENNIFPFTFLTTTVKNQKMNIKKLQAWDPLGVWNFWSKHQVTKYFLSVGRIGMSEGWRKKVTKHTPGLEAGPALSETPGKGFAKKNLSKTHLYSSKFWDDRKTDLLWNLSLDTQNLISLNWAALLSTVYKVISLSRKHPNWNGTS